MVPIQSPCTQSTHHSQFTIHNSQIMKSKFNHILPLFLTIILYSITLMVSAQTADTKGKDQTVSFKVFGVCDDCKNRIESAAMDGKGVKKAEWDKQSNMLVLVGSAKMDKQKVANLIAKAGYKSDLAEADPKGYAKLPGCCQYETGIEKH